MLDVHVCGCVGGWLGVALSRAACARFPPSFVWLCCVFAHTGGIAVTVVDQPSAVLYTYKFYATAGSHNVTSVAPLSGPVAGGTNVTILGTKLSSHAVVTFVERDGSDTVTGLKAECVWRGLEGSAMGSSDTMIR